ncbi:phosphatase [Candidatus Soleaferrea massiliensis]|uniref:phosphatase n=1 Tax=Candidatus Soleaferrea massiliensis TaxID=1470354 RepID=UPI00058C464A|nr:phosphatase [Candidatus Soleaferrea massiliensis]
MKIIAETHCHTIASSHAYSTVLENAQAAKQKGLSYLAITDHGVAMPDAPHIWHFSNLKTLPAEIDGVKILKGVEANILDTGGKLDLPDSLLRKLDWVIASFHEPTFPPSTVKDHTEAYLRIAENPYVDCIGHAGDERFRFELDPVIRAFKEHHKIVEINAHSFSARRGAKENCRRIAEACKRYEVPVVLSSDAHFAYEIGFIENSVNLLKEIDFPQELILNGDEEQFQAFLAYKRREKMK